MRHSIAAVFLFLFLQFYLRSHLELRDLPGAAGTLSVYRALQANSETGSDWSALLLYHLQSSSGFSIHRSNTILSVLSGIFALLGGILTYSGIFGSRPRIGVLLLLAWPFTHYFALLTGVDSLAFGVSWMAIGLLCIGVRSRWIGIPLVCCGLTLLPIAVSIKEAALPILAFSTWSLFSLPQKPQKSVLCCLLFAGGYSLYWSYSWFFPSAPTRLDQTPLDLDSIQRGWQALQALPKRGMPEGKLDQLLALSILGCLLIPKQRIKYLLVSLISFCVVCYTSYRLGGLLRPRYIAPAAYSYVVLLSFVLDQLWTKQTLGKLSAVGIIGLVFMDSWAFFDNWGTSRAILIGSEQPSLPSPPQIWKFQYRKRTDIHQKDLSFYGAIEIIDQIAQTEVGIAVPRLRDDRHNSVKAFTAMYGYDHLILDPGRCCLGTPVDQHCADRIVAQIQQTGLSLAIPKLLDGIERVQANEKSWIVALQQAAEATGQTAETSYWIFLRSQDSTGSAPCQQDWR